jgi:hypothetical protein
LAVNEVEEAFTVDIVVVVLSLLLPIITIRPEYAVLAPVPSL